jgi:predicted transposase YbfD/YdcC
MLVLAPRSSKGGRGGRWALPLLRRVLQQVDPDELDRVVGGWLAAQQPPAATDEGPGAVAVDGKTLRGARQADGHQVQLFAALAHGSGTVLGQRQVPATTNETTQVRSLLEGLDLAGRVVTADALHTLADHARFLVEDKGADYVFAVKGNQPGLETAINRLPSAAFPPPRTEADRGHGRIERRTIRTAPVPAGVRFPHAAQVLELQRHTTDLTGGALRTEVAYGITSLAAARAGPARLGALVRGHWEIENTLHWVRDVTFDEDRSQVRTGMASLRNLAIGRLRLAGHRNIARGLRWAGRDPSRAFWAARRLILLGFAIPWTCPSGRFIPSCPGRADSVPTACCVGPWFRLASPPAAHACRQAHAAGQHEASHTRSRPGPARRLGDGTCCPGGLCRTTTRIPTSPPGGADESSPRYSPSCAVGSNSCQRPLPARFAWYMAASA